MNYFHLQYRKVGSMRSKTPFPINNKLCDFLHMAWTNGWLDEYSNEHFLIKAIENRLSTFVGKEQLIENNIDLLNMVYADGNINTTIFNLNFCINFSQRLQYMMRQFGEKNIKSFIENQLSAGKKHYKEDAFFQALSEISILSFYVSLRIWDQIIYEPSVAPGDNKKNPEAKFIGSVLCKIGGTNQEEIERAIIVNVEVKSPEFPHDNHMNEKIVIPTILLTNDGRKEVQDFCKMHSVRYMAPRVLKLRDFINSAAGKFTIPKDGEFNLLYINWSYRDFPSNSFLEAWSLLTNELNGILTHPKIGESIGITAEAYNKISAVIVYTESLEGLMFSDFRYVWQRNGVGPRFRMWVLDEKLRCADESNILLGITGMNPSEGLTQWAMVDYKLKKDNPETIMFTSELVKIICDNIQGE